LTIIFLRGEEFWIEHHQIAITLQDAAGRYSSGTIPLSKAGVFLSACVTARAVPNNNNSQAMGGVEVKLDAAGNNLTLGDFVTTVAVRVNKAIGTAGATGVNFHVTVFMRGLGLHS